MHTYRKIVAAGATAAAIVGVGTAALATSGDGTTSGSGSGSTDQHAAAVAMVRQHHRPLRHLVHGDVVTHGKHGYVAHSGIRGTVDAVSPSAITVKAADGYTETFGVGKQTRVRERPAGTGHGTRGSIAGVHTGDRVAVLGRKAERSSADPTARIIVDGLGK